MNILFRTRIHQPLTVVKQGFTKELFLLLAPNWSDANLERFDGFNKGDEVHITIKILGRKQKWVSIITDENTDASGWYFIDEGKILPWPLTQWKHTHRVDRIGDKDCEIVDDIEFHTSSKYLDKLIYPFIWSTFAIRPGLYKKFFEV